MPGYGKPLTPQRRLNGEAGLPKNAVAPTIILKEQDRTPLREWQTARGIPIHIWHAFYDLAFGMAFDTAEELIRDGRILPTEQVFQAPGGATSTKVIYKLYYQHAYPLGEAQERPKLEPAFVEDKNGHILPYVRFVGGSLLLSNEALQILAELADAQR
ncbi:MAG: hypothetical protein ABI068_06200 [Ktedonobacterales bacterium]